MVDYLPSTRLQNVPNDNRQDNRFPVTRSKVINIDSDNHDGTAYDGTDNSILIENVEVPNGRVIGVAVAAPDLPVDNDFTLNVYDGPVDNNNQTIRLINKGSISDNTNTYVNLDSDDAYFPSKTVDIEATWTTDNDLTTDRIVFDLVFYVITP